MRAITTSVKGAVMNKSQESRIKVNYLRGLIRKEFPDFKIEDTAEPLLDDGVWMFDVEVSDTKCFVFQFQLIRGNPYGVSDNFEEEFLPFESGNDQTFCSTVGVTDYTKERLTLITA